MLTAPWIGAISGFFFRLLFLYDVHMTQDGECYWKDHGKSYFKNVSRKSYKDIKIIFLTVIVVMFALFSLKL